MNEMSLWINLSGKNAIFINYENCISEYLASNHVLIGQCVCSTLLKAYIVRLV